MSDLGRFGLKDMAMCSQAIRAAGAGAASMEAAADGIVRFLYGNLTDAETGGKALVRRHGGRIRCESQLGAGTAFLVTLSLRSPTPCPATLSASC